jgi:hypothetical protein
MLHPSDALFIPCENTRRRVFMDVIINNPLRPLISRDVGVVQIIDPFDNIGCLIKNCRVLVFVMVLMLWNKMKSIWLAFLNAIYFVGRVLAESSHVT